MCGIELSKYLLSERMNGMCRHPCFPPHLRAAALPPGHGRLNWAQMWMVNSQSAQQPTESAGHEKMSRTFQSPSRGM